MNAMASIAPRHILAALLLGPAAYARAGRNKRAIGSAVLMLLAVVGYAYTYYLAIFGELNTGGDSARELTNTSIQANTALLHAYASWLPGSVGAVPVDQPWLRRRHGPPVPGGPPPG